MNKPAETQETWEDRFVKRLAELARQDDRAALAKLRRGLGKEAGFAPERDGWVIIHTGKMLSFVYDVADFYKTDTTVPLAFRLAATVSKELERTVRQECRQVFHAYRLMDKILPDIAEVLHAGDAAGETAEEMEGRAISLADRGPAGDIPGEPESAGPG
jgi:hypothetical protein